MANELQLDIFDKIKKEICSNIEFYPVRKKAIEVVKPFLDWNGSNISVFITEDGRITDGGEVLSQLRSLQIFDDFNNWPFKEDFFSRYYIKSAGACLESNDPSSPRNIIRYMQGITRLPNYFEPKPIYDASEQFPNKVHKMTIEALLPFAPSNFQEDDRRLWAKEFTKERPIKLNGIEVRSDMSPKRHFRMVQIISHATSSKYVKKQHVDAKVLPPVLWKRKENRVDVYFIVEDLSAYPSESRTLLRQESNENIIEINETGSEKQIAKIMLEA
jgi:hypothetical protein